MQVKHVRHPGAWLEKLCLDHVAINFQKSSSKIIEWKIIPNFLISEKSHSCREDIANSVDFYAFFGVVREVCGVKKGMRFGTQVWISMPFLGLSGRFAASKKGIHFGARVWISMPFLGFLGKAAAWKGKQFKVSGRGWRKLLFDLSPPPGGLDWAVYVGHFKALVLGCNRKGFPLEDNFGASWAMFKPILGHLGAPRQLAGLKFKFSGPLSRALMEYRVYIGVMLGHFGGQNGEISAT